MKKEIVRQALRHQKPERVPHYFGLTHGAQRKLQEYYGASYEQEIDNYLRLSFFDHPDLWARDEPDLVRDIWGIQWDRSVDKDIGVPRRFLFPEPDMKYWNPPSIDESRKELLRRSVSGDADCFSVVALSFFTLYDRAWALRGIENLLTDMLLHPRFVNDLLDALTEWSIRATEVILSVPGVDMVLFSDDWGQQTGLTMGMPMWQKFLRPRLARLFRVVTDSGKFLAIHSCGKIEELFPSLIELGVDVVNPFQPEVMDVHSLSRQYGGRLSFWGGLSVQRTLPMGSPDDVRREVAELWEMGREGGYILSPSHDITPDVPIDNLIALVETVKTLGTS